MRKTHKYSIGDYVIVFRKKFRDKKNLVVKWQTIFSFLAPRLGQVVGLCTRYDGKTIWPTMSYDGDCDPPYFQREKSHRFWLVRFGLMNKPVEIGEEDMRLAAINEVKELPTLYPKPVMLEREKQNLSEDSKHWPRDERGRWIVGPAV